MGIRKNIRDDFDPSQWEVIYLEDTNHEDIIPGANDWMWLPDEYKHLVNRLKNQIRNDEVPWGCAHCGQTRLRWIAYIWNEATDEVAMVGQVCADRAELRNQGAMFRRDRERALESARQSAEQRAKRDAWNAANPELAKFLDDYAATHGEGFFDIGNCDHCGHDAKVHGSAFEGADNYRFEVFWCGEEGCGCDRRPNLPPNGDQFVADMVRARRLYGALTDRQTEVLAQKPAQIAARIARFKDVQAKIAARAEDLKGVAGLEDGRRELKGTIKSVKELETDFGWTLKMLVELEDGNRVWGTVPNAVVSQADLAVPEGTTPEDWDEARQKVLVGAQIVFTGTLKVSDDDSHFAFFSRPSKATVDLVVMAE